MSNLPPPTPGSEPSMMGNSGNVTNIQNQRNFSLFGRRGPSAPVNLQIPGLKDLQKTLTDLTTAINNLTTTMTKLSQTEEKTKKFFSSVRSEVKDTSQAINDLGKTTDMSSGSSAGSKITSFLSSAMPGLNTTQPNSSLGGLASIIANVGAVMTYPLNYAFNRAEQLRGTTVSAAQMLGPMASQSGMTIQGLMSSLGKGVPFGGDMNNLLGAMDVGRSMGFNPFGTTGAMNARGVSFGQGVQQLQNLYPGVGAQQLAQQYGGMLSNVQGQKAWYLMGGVPAYGTGAVPKSFDEWAEGFLQFFQNQRPGSDRGKPFTKEELTSQMFPGSNINAWFQTNQVPGSMIDAWWTYVITKANAGGVVGQPLTEAQITKVRGTDLARQRLISESVYTRRDLGTGAAMYPSFTTRETTDQKFAEVLSNFDDLIRSVNAPLGKLIGSVPTPVMNMLMSLINNAPSMAGSLIHNVDAFGFMAGDPAFVGDGPYGSMTTAGLHPDLASGVSAMMRANPRLRITSGMRSAALQESMNRRGIGRVAPNGKSNHTRGWAADLGPSSEFGWIAANASKFGLQHFGSHGEPWHVQLPGVGAGDPYVGDAVSHIPFVGGLISGAGSFLKMMGNLVGTGFKGAQSLVSNLFGGNLVQALTSFLNPQDILKNVAGSLFSVLGIPDFLNPFKLLTGGVSGAADDLVSAFMSMLGLPAAKLGAGSGTLQGEKIAGGATIAPFNLTLSPFRGVSSATGIKPVGGGGQLVLDDNGNIVGQSGSGITVSPGPGPATSAGGVVLPPGVSNSSGTGTTNTTYSGSGKLTPEQVAQFAYNAGFRGQALIDAVAIAGRESSDSPTAYNPKASTKDNSYGLWQINMLGSLGPDRSKALGITSNNDLFDPATNARAAYMIYSAHTPPSFYDWGGYKPEWNYNPLYNTNTALAAQAVRNAGLGDPYGGISPGMYSNMYAPNTHISSMSAPVTVINHITVSSGSMGDGLNVRYVAKRLADASTQEVKRAMEGVH